MSRDARKKEKHRLKRKEKQQRLRKLNARTALQRIAAEGGQLECWITPDDWKEQGIGSIQVLGHAPGGRAAFAAFLVDLWAVGLKDAFGRSDVPALEFREQNIESWIERTDAVKLAPQVARRLVAGGVRFGRQNAFRMPPGWEKWVVIFGRDVLNEIPTADLSDFGVEGGLRYVGSMEFLQQRLAMPINEFLARPDVQFVVQPDIASPESEPFDDFAEEEQDEPEFLEEFDQFSKMVDAGAADIATRAREWCTARGDEPIPLLDEAARIVIASMLPAIFLKESGREPTDEELEQAGAFANLMLSQRSPAERKVVNDSVDRLRECMAQIAETLPASERTSAPPEGGNASA